MDCEIRETRIGDWLWRWCLTHKNDVAFRHLETLTTNGSKGYGLT